jgi:hypothetical protein
MRACMAPLRVVEKVRRGAKRARAKCNVPVPDPFVASQVQVCEFRCASSANGKPQPSGSEVWMKDLCVCVCVHVCRFPVAASAARMLLLLLLLLEHRMRHPHGE